MQTQDVRLPDDHILGLFCNVHREQFVLELSSLAEIKQVFLLSHLGGLACF